MSARVKKGLLKLPVSFAERALLVKQLEMAVFTKGLRSGARDETLIEEITRAGDYWAFLS
jgi:hypothetical protein